MRVVNSRIERVRVLQVVPNPSADPGREYVLIATGLAEPREQRVDLRDEQFGVFVADSTLTVILRVVDVFKTERWLDYEVHIETGAQDSLVVVGIGKTYADQRVRRAYGWGR
jgi:hypothetical protein